MGYCCATSATPPRADRVDAAVAAELVTRGENRRSTDEIGDALPPA